MKLLIDNEYKEIGFWSFMKCNLLVSLALTGLIYGAFFVLGIIILAIGS